MRTRARRIAVRVSEEQYNKIWRLTDRSFFTKEQVLRDIVLGYPIQEDRKPECMKLIMLLRKIAGNLSGLCRNYGLSDLPIGKEMKQTANAVEDTEYLIKDCIFITRKKRRIK
ncbi:MAG: hypothetical protein J6D06_11575 [Clostridia bacterium]|nr:hypothetical protein [Clostridia bacterium]